MKTYPLIKSKSQHEIIKSQKLNCLFFHDHQEAQQREQIKHEGISPTHSWCSHTPLCWKLRKKYIASETRNRGVGTSCLSCVGGAGNGGTKVSSGLRLHQW